MSRYLLISADDTFERRVGLAFGGGEHARVRRLWGDGQPVKPVDLLAAVATGDPEAVVIGPDVPLDAALEYARGVDLEQPDVSVALVCEPTTSMWAEAVRAGVREVVPHDATGADLRDALERVAATTRHRRERLVAVAESPARGRIITVVSPKGGAGKTTVATNVAVGLAADAPGEVVLVDADLQFGDVASGLQLMPEHTIADAARANGSLDAMTAKVYLTSHPTDLFALCAPDSPAEGEDITAERLAHIIELLAEQFRYVVVDTSAGLTETTLSALEVSDDLVVVCSMDVPSVRSLKKELDTLDQVGMTRQRRHLVLNRADARVGMDAGDIESLLGMSVDVAVPSSRAVPLSLNQGLPLLHADPRSPVARRLRDLVDRFVDKAPVTPTSGWFFSRKAAR